MRRYKFLSKEDVFDALNKLRSAFLAAKDGNEVEEIINGILTSDERMKIGRRILIAGALEEGLTYDEIKDTLKVGKSTVVKIEEAKRSHPLAFQLVGKREKKVDEEYKNKAYRKVGGAKMIFKKKEYTGFKRKDVVR